MAYNVVYSPFDHSSKTLHRTNNAERQFNRVMIVSHYSECVLVCFFHTLVVSLCRVHQILLHTLLYGMLRNSNNDSHYCLPLSVHFLLSFLEFRRILFRNVLVLFLGASLFGNVAENLMA